MNDFKRCSVVFMEVSNHFVYSQTQDLVLPSIPWSDFGHGARIVVDFFSKPIKGMYIASPEAALLSPTVRTKSACCN